MKFLFIILIIILFSVSAIPAFSQSPTLSKLENKFDVTQNCSNGWNVSGYYLPLESDYTSKIIPITIDTKIYNFKSDFVEEVKIQGWGKTFSEDYLGFYDGAFHLSKTPLDSLGNNLIVGSIATDPQSIKLGTKVTISTLPSPWNEMIFSANDTSPLITGKEIVVYTGDGLNAKNETVKIASNNNSICLVNELIPVNQISNQNDQEIPNWIKNNAKWWSSNQIDDNTFVSGIQFLIKENIIHVEQSGGKSENQQNIPKWIKNTAGFWANDQIGDKEFIQALQWLINNDILHIPQKQELASNVKMAGWWLSQYGTNKQYGQNQTNTNYWINVAQKMSQQFPGSKPGGILVIGYIEGANSATKTVLPFPKPSGTYPNVNFSSIDTIEPLLTAYDKAGLKVYLQVESADADVPMLMDLIMKRYKHHSSVIGFGVDVEWYHQSKYPGFGKPLTDNEVTKWSSQVKTYNPNYGLTLTHWDATYLSNARPDNVLFLTDSEHIGSIEAAIGNYTSWVDHFAPSQVGFHLGYPSDISWWGGLTDPASSIINPVIEARPNANIGGVYWVHFSATKAFPIK
jgi:3D (Asp-Asp-Asp) domain-containing protein